MKTFCFLMLAGTLFLGGALAAQAHFGMVIPSRPVITEMPEADLNVDLKFWHPFENSGMDLAKPKNFQVFVNGQPLNLKDKLRQSQARDFKTWTAGYKTERPGLYVFVMEPEPYWEPEEDKFIIHYTKAYVGAFGDDEGWSEPQGLKTEIVPLTNPTGLYAGGLFTGRILLDGKAVPGGEVEVEWYPGESRKSQAPHEGMITQTLVADDRGVFNFVAPKAGWWGLAALNEADYKLKRDNKDKNVELGGVIWVYFHEMKDDQAFTAE